MRFDPRDCDDTRHRDSDDAAARAASSGWCWGREDIEVVTPHDRGAHAASVARAGVGEGGLAGLVGGEDLRVEPAVLVYSARRMSHECPIGLDENGRIVVLHAARDTWPDRLPRPSSMRAGAADGAPLDAGGVW